MANKIINTFGKLNTDTSVNKYPANAYFNAKNLRKISDDSLETGAMNNFPAPESIIQSFQSQGKILGTTLVRDTLIVFYLVTATGDSIIFKAENGDAVFTTLYNDSSSTTKLNFNADNPIRAIGRYESDLIQKVYWCDGLNPNSFINIASTYASGYEASLLRLTPNADLHSPVPQEVTSGGILQSGTIYYTYQLYKNYGNQTTMSSSSFGVPLSSRNGNDLDNFRGDEVEVETGNSVLIKFDNLDTNFDRIKIYSIHFSDINADPTINLISEQSFNETTIYYTDSGAVSLESLTTESFLIQGGRIFSSETLETKYNYLFAGNITEVSNDVDSFDARAYRFDNSVTPTARLYNSDGVTYQDITSPNTTVTEDDAINQYNNYENDTQYIAGASRSSDDYRFQSDGSTPGGEGPNTSYEFITQNLEGNTTSGGKPTDNWSRKLDDYNNSLINPILAGKYKGYKRDEVYRFGVEILFKNGQKSFVKWIGDVRFPNLDDEALTTLNGSVYETRQLGLRLSIDFSDLTANELTDMSGFKVVRAKRNTQDKNILHQGIAGPYMEFTDGTTNTPNIGVSGNFWGTNLRIAYMSEVGGTSVLFNDALIPNRPYTTGDPMASTLVMSDTMFEYISPDVVMNKGVVTYNGIDKIYANDLSLIHTRAPIAVGPSNFAGIYREDNYNHLATSNRYITDINGSKNLSVNYNSGTQALTSFASNKIYNRTYIQKSGTVIDGAKGYDSILDLTAFASLGGTGTDTMIFDYIRNRFNSQYGGNTYEARSLTNYIPALCRIGTTIDADVVEFIPKSELGGTSGNEITLDVFGGDSYTCYFDYLRSGIQQDDRIINGTCQHYITFPVESEFNLEYRRDELNKYLTTDTEHALSTDSYKVQEDKTQGLTWNPENYPSELTDLFLYNDAYSRGNDITTNTQRPIDFQETMKFDTMVLGSDKKFNNESVDSWTQYDFNSFLEVDSSYGPVNSLKNHNNKLIYFQDHGFGVLAVEDREQLATESGIPLTLGIGGVLERYDYISTSFGCLRDEAVLSTPNNLYFIDESDKSIRTISSSDLEGNLSKIKGVSNKVKGFIPSTYISLGYDPQNKEVLFSFDDTTLAFSELDKEFIGEYDIFADQDSADINNFYKVDRYESINDELFLINFRNTEDRLHAYKANSSLYPLGEYSEVTLLLHPNGNDIFSFENLDIRSSVFTDFTESLPNNTDIVDDTVSQIDYKNSYLPLTTITTNPGLSTALINRLVRSWRTTVPLTSNSNRFVDSYLLVTLRFDHTSNRKISLYDVTSYVRKAKQAR